MVAKGGMSVIIRRHAKSFLRERAFGVVGAEEEY